MCFRNFLTGVGHSISWLLSPDQDILILNPNFKPGNKEITIECIHGLADGPHALKAMIELIKEVLPDNVKQVRLLAYEKRNQTTIVDANQIKKKILHYGDANIVFIAHSHGGLTTTTLIEELAHDLKDKVDILGAIILGTPFHGAALARWPFTVFMPAVAEMHYNSEMLKNLREKVRLRMVSDKDFYSTLGFGLDGLVKNTSVCLHVDTHTEIPGASHLGCLYDYHTIRTTLLKLYRLCGPFTGPKRDINSNRQLKSDPNCLMNAVAKIQIQIKDLKSRFHLDSIKDKEKVLKNLCDILEEMHLNREQNLYSKAKTLGEFIECYLYDIYLSSSPYLTLRKAKNFSNAVKPTSLIFVENLIIEYMDIKLDMEPIKIHDNNVERRPNSLKI